MTAQINIFSVTEETTAKKPQKKPEKKQLSLNAPKKNKRSCIDDVPIQYIKIKPNSLVIYTERKNYSGRQKFDENQNSIDNENFSFRIAPNDDPLLKGTKKQRSNIHNGFLSDRAGNRLRTWIKFLLWSSGCFKIHGKKIDLKMTGKISFITLTLPSPQVHSDQEIKANCLNQFITEMKAKHINLRYIWRCEKQNNGNIHFHFLVNRFVNYDWCQFVWNRIMKKEGYIEPYQKKFSSMSFQEYCEQKKNFSIDKIPIYTRQFNRGNKENWSNPPSIQAKGLGNTRKALYYIAKYISKNDQKPDEMSADQIKKLSITGHIWFCCYELSSLVCPTEFMTNEVCHDLKIIHDLEPESFIYENYATIVKRPIEYLFNLGCYNIFNIFVGLFGVLNKNELFSPT
jgi:hypothetical protein